MIAAHRPRALAGPLVTLLFALTAPAALAAEDPAPPAADGPTVEQAPAPAVGSDADAAFVQANRLYLEGRYQEAVKAYADIHASLRVEDPVLYHNLGNACFRSGAYGSAILYYRRAARLDPPAAVAESIAANLDAARRTLQARYRTGGDASQFVYGEAEGLFYKVTHAIGPTTLALVFGAAWFLLLGLMIARRLRPARRATFSRVAIPTAVAVLLLGVMMWGQAWSESSVRLGIIVKDDVKLRDGKHERAQGKDIPEGMEVRIVEHSAPWIKVEMTNGRQGWVPDHALKQI